MRKSLLVSDYDGTLYNDECVVERRVIEKIKEYNDLGGYFTVCTGRAYQGFHAFDSEYINAPVLLGNGAMAFDYQKNEVVFLDGLGEECFDFIRFIRDNYPKVSIEIYAFQESYCINLIESTRNHFRILSAPLEEINDPSETKLPIVKIMLGCEFGESPEIQEIIKTRFPEVDYLPTTGRWIEVLKKGVNKGSGMLKLAEILGIDESNTYSIGDGYNDVDMLKAAAFSFVPANGGEEAKSAADMEVPSNDDGAVMHAVQYIIDKQKDINA